MKKSRFVYSVLSFDYTLHGERERECEPYYLFDLEIMLVCHYDRVSFGAAGYLDFGIIFFLFIIFAREWEIVHQMYILLGKANGGKNQTAKKRRE